MLFKIKTKKIVKYILITKKIVLILISGSPQTKVYLVDY